MSLTNDVKAEMTASRAVSLMVILTVFGVIAAVGLPVAIDSIEDDTEKTFTQDVNTDYDVSGKLVSNVTAITDGADATVELNDTRTASTTSKTINVGANATYTLDGGDVDVGVESATAGSPDQAVVNYTYATEYSYGSGASSIWNILGLAIVLGAFLYAIYVGLKASNRV